MNISSKLACVAVAASLGACASAPSVHHVTLDDGRPRVSGTANAPSIAVVRANLPDLIDRPQLVIRTDRSHFVFSDQYRWAESMRREIPRVMARDLGELLNSNRVAALPAEAGSFNVDYKLMLDIQQLEAIAGEGVDVDVLWRLEDRGGKILVGRSTFRQPLDGAATGELGLVAAQQKALRRVAVEIAKAIAPSPVP